MEKSLVTCTPKTDKEHTYEVRIGDRTLELALHLSPDASLRKPLESAETVQRVLEGVTAELEAFVQGLPADAPASLESYGPGVSPQKVRPRGNMEGYVEYKVSTGTVPESQEQWHAHAFSFMSGGEGIRINRCDATSVVATYTAGLKAALENCLQSTKVDALTPAAA